MKKMIAIVLTLMLCLSVLSMAAFAAPDGLNSLAVVGSGIPGVAEWNPGDPNGDMTEVSAGVYEKTLTCTAGTSMKLKIAGNDDWVDAWNFGSATLALGQKADLTCGGGSQDMPLTIDKDCTIKITVDLTAFDGTAGATILVEEVGAGSGSGSGSTTQPTTPPTTTQPTTQPSGGNTSGTYTLYVKAPASWTTVNAYTWEPDDFGTWPGAAMKKDGEYYKASIKGTMKNLIINNGTAKTDDLVLEGGKDVYVVVAEDGKATVTYKAPTGGSTGGNRQPADPEPTGSLSNYRVVGNAEWMGNWKENSDAGRMVEVEPGVYKKNFNNVKPGSYELKITKDGKWDGAYGDNGNNYCFTVDQECTITVTFTLKDNVGVIHVKGAGVPATADIPMISVVVLMVLATATAVILITNKKKFI